MSLIQIPTTIDGVDTDLNQNTWSSDHKLLYEPAQIKDFESQLLFESAMIQWSLTRWRQIKANNPIMIEGSEQEIELLQRMSSSVPGSIMAILPNGKIQNVNRRSTAVFREKFFNNQKNWPDLIVSESSAIICLDSYLAGLPKQLYPKDGFDQLSEWDGFRKVIEGLISSVASKSDVKGKINERVDRISTIIFELFKNTHDHARITCDGKIISDSVRGLYSRFYPIEKLKTSIPNKNRPPLNQAEHYVDLLTQPKSSSSFIKSNRDLTGFLELSIFDSGPGLASKWLGRDVTYDSPQDQLNAVMECFGKGRSSLSSSLRGFGLWKVLEELKQLKGMIRVRTNRVHAMRQYAMLEGQFRDIQLDGSSTPQVVMLDWRRGQTQKMSEYPAVDGTLISVLLPLGEL